MTMDDEALLAMAARLCGEAGLAQPRALTRLSGGKNNRVFRVSLEEGSAVVLKSYFHDPRDMRDRLRAEWGFLSFAWERGVRACPKPLARDTDAHAGLYAMLPGEKLAASAVMRAHVEAAADFVSAVNAPPREIDDRPLGSEACLSLRQHIVTIDRRVERLATLADDAPFREEAEKFVTHYLKPAWALVRTKVVGTSTQAKRDLDTVIDRRDVIMSPSDFGFHNTLLGPDGVLRFLDFEYAGRDDPAKLAGDFFACPEIPAPKDAFGAFVDGLGNGLGLSAEARDRAHLLRDAYRIKWTCIIFNDFLPSDDARRAFALAEDRAERCARQLARAEAKLAEIGA
jgi:phosphotransferase family enzyme